MIDPDEILKNSYHADKTELKDFVYTEYLQLLIVKYINEVNLEKYRIIYSEHI